MLKIVTLGTFLLKGRIKMLRRFMVPATLVALVVWNSGLSAQTTPPPPPPLCGNGPCPPTCTQPQANQIAIFNTGVDNCGGPLYGGNLAGDLASDLHYSVVGSGPAIVVQNGVFPLDGNWFADGPNSKWLAPTAGGAFTTFDYQTTFDLSGFDPTTVTLTGKW